MKIYLAGPDAFRPDALTWAEDARALLARHGHYALIPSDNDETGAEGIFRATIEDQRGRCSHCQPESLSRL